MQFKCPHCEAVSVYNDRECREIFMKCKNCSRDFRASESSPLTRSADEGQRRKIRKRNIDPKTGRPIVPKPPRAPRQPQRTQPPPRSVGRAIEQDKPSKNEESSSKKGFFRRLVSLGKSEENHTSR